jgi:hypothetical protein
MEDRIESDNVGWPGVVGAVEEDEFHSSGTCGKHTKVCSFGGGCRAERIRRGGVRLLNGRIVKLDGLLM